MIETHQERIFCAGNNSHQDVKFILNLIPMDGGDITYNLCILNNSWLDGHFKETRLDIIEVQ